MWCVGVGGASPRTAGRGHWRSFIDGLQRVVVFTYDKQILNRITASDRVSRNMLEVSVTLRSIGVSLTDDTRRREVAYIGVTQYV